MKINSDENGKFWVNGTQFSSFKINGFSDSSTKSENYLQLKATKNWNSYIEPVHILNMMELSKYYENIESEIKTINSTVFKEEKDYLFLLKLFRGEYLPTINQKYFKQLLKAITNKEISLIEMERLSKLSHFSLRSLKTLNIPLESLLGSSEEALIIQEYALNYKEEENLDIKHSLAKILQKGLDSYNDSEMYTIIMKLLREIYLKYPEYQEAIDPIDEK